ncbi:unnamed protein product [Meloidogyne enterolobii]|uniref:Uncharacterized protein n=1 Tax=Meloidogyne enterolobii TaxID=390850 RepID=A0ACB0ZZN9_MELEN
MCFELKSMGYCDNAVYKAMMQKHCLSECGANACFDKRADLFVILFLIIIFTKYPSLFYNL